MYPVLIGSRALNFWFPKRKIKPETDWDVISFKEHKGCEVHDPLFLNNQAMTGYRSSQTLELPDGDKAYVMSPLGLAILKRSHLWRDLSFQKHITDFHKHGLNRYLQEEYYDKKAWERVQKDLLERTRMTQEAFKQGHPSLMQSVEDFFSDGVKKVFEHDYLHQMFAYYEEPLYKRLQNNPELAWCDKNLWYNLSYEDRVKCVAEEVQVIAFERFIVPSQGWTFPSKLAYMKALNKVCTTLCSGWFRDFAIDNYPQILELYSEEHFRQVGWKILAVHPNERKYYVKSRV